MTPRKEKALRALLVCRTQAEAALFDKMIQGTL